jgi:peptidoglycan L-alanyl-D-glutamate endopeptidase CwlK
VDERSERNILTLLPPVQDPAREFIRQLHSRGWDFRITSGTRSYAEQDALFKQASNGRDDDGDGRIDEADEMVTKARGGQSNHNFGIAIDITLFENGKPVWESPHYREASAIGKALGFDWGGDWTRIKDLPHYEFRPGWAKSLSESAMLAELRRRVANRIPIF